jgi:hypothetical protein
MDCKHCNKPLPLLKRLGDAQFCCVECERAWKEAIQSAMIERLRASAEQFRRAVQSARPEGFSTSTDLTVSTEPAVHVGTPLVAAGQFS